MEILKQTKYTLTEPVFIANEYDSFFLGRSYLYQLYVLKDKLEFIGYEPLNNSLERLIDARQKKLNCILEVVTRTDQIQIFGRIKQAVLMPINNVEGVMKSYFTVTNYDICFIQNPKLFLFNWKIH